MTKVHNRLFAGHYLLIALIMIVLSAKLSAQNSNLALTPPMGWNSWNAYEAKIDETIPSLICIRFFRYMKEKMIEIVILINLDYNNI